jgi:hypothetical protein
VSSKSKLEKNTFVEDLTLSEHLCVHLAVGLLENKSKSSALDMYEEQDTNEDELKDAVMKTSIVLSRSS